MGVPDYEPSLGSKRKRGVKSLSVTPSVNEDDEDDRQPVRGSFILLWPRLLSLLQKRRKQPPKSNGNDVPPAVREKMKKVFAECYRAVVACEDSEGRKRCELFRELPDRHVSLAREPHSHFIDRWALS
jgi:ATP-dependent helicase STH1/SNF2